MTNHALTGADLSPDSQLWNTILPADPALTARLRAGVIRLARAFAANATRLDQLVEWDAPGRCAGGK